MRVLLINFSLKRQDGNNIAFESLLSSMNSFAGIGLTGTKLGCGEGGCGACTVMVSSLEQKKLQHRAINACLCPLYAVEGMHVVTVEGAPLWSSRLQPYGVQASPDVLRGGEATSFTQEGAVLREG